MEKDLERYLIKNYLHLLKNSEREIYQYFIRQSKIQSFNQEQIEIMKKHNPSFFIESENELLRDEFFEEVCMRILKDEPVFINRCPLCGTLARTPFALQAKCGHRWDWVNGSTVISEKVAKNGIIKK